MQAIREIYNVDSEQIVINLPEEFRKKKIEVILLPLEPDCKKPNRASGPEFSTEAQEFLNLGGSGCWEGDLDQMREMRNGTG